MNHKINPLNVHRLRRLAHCPPNFQPVYFDLRAKEKDMADWIYEHLDGRFYLDSQTRWIDSRPLMRHCAAFEEHSEASYFSLMLTEVNKPNSSL